MVWLLTGRDWNTVGDVTLDAWDHEPSKEEQDEAKAEIGAPFDLYFIEEIPVRTQENK